MKQIGTFLKHPHLSVVYPVPLEAQTLISLVCVDDEPPLLEIARLFLERSGEIRVTPFPSAQDALDSPDVPSCDVIVSDYQMPGMDGIGFLKEVRNRFGDIPFILFTGRGREDVVIEAINNGADFYLQKGGDPTSQFAELEHKVRQAVRRRTAERSKHELEQRLADIIDFLPDAMLAVDTEGKVIAWNRAIEDLTGVPASGILGKGNYEYALSPYGERRPLLLDMLSRPDEEIGKYYTGIARDGNAITAETRLAAPRGRQIHIMAKAAPLYNQQGGIAGVIEVIRDISALKKTEHDLRAAYEQVTMNEEELRSQFDELRVANEQLFAAKETLRVNEERLALAQSVGRSGSWEYDTGTKTFWVSAECARIWGYPAVAGKISTEKIEACIQDPATVRRAITGALYEGKDYDIEYTINPADGAAPRGIHSVARLLKNASGQPARLVGIARDITERRDAELALHESTERYRLMMMNAKDGIMVNELTPHGPGRFIEINEPACRILGMTREEIKGISLADLDTPEMKQMAPEIVARLKKERHAIFPVMYRPKTGGEKHLDISVSILDMNGCPAMLSIVRDLTGQIETERALCESEERFRILVETSPDMIWEIDPEGKFRYISPRIKTLMGYSPEEVTGKHITFLVADQGKALAERKIRDHLASGDFTGPFVVPARHRDGHDMAVEIRSFTVTGTEGKITGFRGVARDVTEWEKAEKTLRRANRQLTLLGSVSRHDSLNKITVILGYLKIAEKKCTEPEVGEFLKKMESAITAMRTQVEFTRVYQNIGSQDPQWLSLEAILSGLQVPSPVTLTADVGGIRLLADPLLETVFANLLDNAVRHGERVTAVRVSSHREGTALVVVFEDNGIGVPVANKERIFDRGYGKNTGLGLFLVREILSLTGIAIREAGEPGRGARFEFLVPEGAYRVTP